jgi:hypothetical protein
MWSNVRKGLLGARSITCGGDISVIFSSHFSIIMFFCHFDNCSSVFFIPQNTLAVYWEPLFYCLNQEVSKIADLDTMLL